MIERRIFGLTRTLRAAAPGDVQRILMSADPGDDPSYTWRDDERRVAVVVSVIDADHCQVALLDGGRWHDLVDSDDPTLAWVSLTGTPGVVPLASILPCRFAVDALETVTIGAGFDHLRATRRWRPAPAWVGDRRGYLLRDLVEVLWDAAGSLPVDEPPAAAGPVGLRHLALLRRLHDRAVGGGLGAVLADLPPDRLCAAADHLGMPELRAVLRDADDDAYERLVSPDGDDAGAIRAAVQRKLDAAPWEFGVTDVPGRAITEFLADPGRVR